MFKVVGNIQLRGKTKEARNRIPLLSKLGKIPRRPQWNNLVLFFWFFSILLLSASIIGYGRVLKAVDASGVRVYFMEIRVADGLDYEVYSKNIVATRNDKILQDILLELVKCYCLNHTEKPIEDPAELYRIIYSNLNEAVNITVIYLTSFDINVDHPILYGKTCKTLQSSYFQHMALNYTNILLAEPESGRQIILQLRVTPVDMNIYPLLMLSVMILLFVEFSRHSSNYSTGSTHERKKNGPEKASIIDSIVSYVYAGFLSIIFLRVLNEGIFIYTKGSNVNITVLFFVTIIYFLYKDLKESLKISPKSLKKPKSMWDILSLVVLIVTIVALAFSIPILSTQIVLLLNQIVDYITFSLQNIDIFFSITIVGIVLIFTARYHSLLSSLIHYYSILIMAIFSFLTVENTIYVLEDIGSLIISNPYVNVYLDAIDITQLLFIVLVFGIYVIKLYNVVKTG